MAPTAVEVDLCVIGSGSGNSLIDERFDQWRVAMVERGVGSTGAYGGTCLNVGCIPTKMFAYPATLATAPAEAARLGVGLESTGADWPAIRDRIFGRIDEISRGGRDWRRQNENVTLLEGTGTFRDPHTLEVTTVDGPRTVRADRFVLAVGSRPRALDVPGADTVPIHTSDDIMRLDELPESIIILGGGFIAAEFAHIFTAFGTRVMIINRSGALLRHHDTEISDRFTRVMGQRMAVHLNEQITAVSAGGHGVIVHTADADGREHQHTAQVVLNATGRVPNSDTLNLSAAGIDVDDAGRVVVDAHQVTSQPHVYALGDVCSPWQLKHVANHEAKVVQHNLLHPDTPIESDHRFVPAAVFGSPQIAAVGPTEAEAREQYDDVVAIVQDYGSVAYGWAMEDTDHVCKLVGRRDGTLLGAHLIGPEASILIQPIVQGLAHGLSVDDMARGQYWIHPALTELIENALLAFASACETS